MIPQFVINEATEKANLEIDEVFSLAFVESLIENKYNFDPEYHKNKTDNELVAGTCQCAYCRSLRRYVELKKEHHRTKKRLYNDDMMLFDEIDKVEVSLSELKKKYKQAKKDKDKIKTDLQI